MVLEEDPPSASAASLLLACLVAAATVVSACTSHAGVGPTPAPAASQSAESTNSMRMASLGFQFRYPLAWSEGAAADPNASCFGCTIVGPVNAGYPYGVEIFTEDLDPGCTILCYTGNNAISPGGTPEAPPLQGTPVNVAAIAAVRLEIGRAVPLGIANATGDDTPYREIWTLVPWYGKALFFVAFYREGDRTADLETRAAYDELLASVARISPIPLSNSYPPRTVSVGESITVWGYADASPTRERCIDALPDMMPASAEVAGGRLITCTVDAASASRLRFVADGADVLHIDRVEVLVPATEPPPASEGEPDCLALRPTLLAATADARAAAVRLTCLVKPPARGAAGEERTEVRAYVLPNTGPVAAAAPVGCWELARFLGPLLEGETVMVPCVLE